MIGKAAVSIGGILSTKRDDDDVTALHPSLAHDRSKNRSRFFGSRSVPRTSGSNWLPAPSHAICVATCLRESLHCVVWGPSKAGSEFPCQHVKTKALPRDFASLTKR